MPAMEDDARGEEEQLQPGRGEKKKNSLLDAWSSGRGRRRTRRWKKLLVAEEEEEIEGGRRSAFGRGRRISNVRGEGFFIKKI